MTDLTFEEVQQDDLAMSVARALALANDAAALHGMEPGRALVTITEEPAQPRVWRIHYGPRDYVHRRGGDLTVLVDDETGVLRILRGQ